MISLFVSRLVDFCRRKAAFVFLASLLLSCVLGSYVAHNLKMNTDVDQLLSQDLTWRQREKALEKAFPQNVSRLAIVIDSAEPDKADFAAQTLFEEMLKRPDLFKNVKRPDAIPYFQKNGLLFLDEDQLADMTETLIKAQPLMGSLANDPSLRGLFKTLELVALGIKEKAFDAAKIEEPFALLAKTIDDISQGKNVLFPWRGLMTQGNPTLRDTRKFILTQPLLDFESLSPGKKASDAVRQIAREKNLTPENGIAVRLTGSVALSDEEFASVADGAIVSTVASLILVFVLLFLALRSIKLILPIVYTLIVGLLATTAFATAAIGSLNLISVAFAVMFVGIAVDFGIQFGVRYRDQRFLEPDGAKAMTTTAKTIANPLAMAAASTSLGFLAFTPTDYRGVAELGAIASFGMLVAFFLNITLLPALLALFKPPAEKEAIGYKWAAPVDRFLQAQRKPCLWIAGFIGLSALIVATQIRFDFDPLNLKDPKTESVATLFDIMKDPDATPYTIEILAPSLDEAKKLSNELEKLPEVDHVLSLSSFVPSHQDEKLATLAEASTILAPTLFPEQTQESPNPDSIRESMLSLSDSLASIDGSAAKRLSAALRQAAEQKDPTLFYRLDQGLLQGALSLLAQAQNALGAEAITEKDITDDLSRDWISADGQAKLEVYPKGDARDHTTLIAFTNAVRRIAPDATGSPISIQESGETIVRSFTLAGCLALIVIALMAFAILKRAMDVALLILPMILAGILTLATMVIIHLPLNFANIIALPLLLSLGVSYAVYFISYWRAGNDNPLQSSMARAVLFSAATMLIAFGSLSLSAHVGTSGMGELLTIALIYSLLCTFFVLPPLLGKPKTS